MCCSTEIWANLFAHSDFTLPSSIDQIVLWCKASTGNGKVNTICMLLVHAIVYFLWRERNARLHTLTAKSGSALIKEIRLLLRAKLRFGSRFHGLGKLESFPYSDLLPPYLVSVLPTLILLSSPYLTLLLLLLLLLVPFYLLYCLLFIHLLPLL
ncbi:unnamed protein product [Microthlaspi erraticum]|uniref:Reverse transcriptase zinc-binding domain-containing protein n=1 Tax=Microthlaspi erraticum TaxID=1685480 RepID=A0A6D2J4A8_9BRAS|nr:unnamed protein product [Microthlaspi erraticum]